MQAGGVTLESLEKLLASLPGDMREQCLESAAESSSGALLLKQLGYDPATIASTYGNSQLRTLVLNWKQEMKLYRVRLVTAAVTRWLEETRGEYVNKDGTASQLAMLAADAGPYGQDLNRWLRVRGRALERKPA